MQMYLAMTEWNEAAFMALVSGPLWQFLLGSESSDPITLHASQTNFSVRLCAKLRASLEGSHRLRIPAKKKNYSDTVYEAIFSLVSPISQS
jgi:hypothetical protein